MSEKKINRYVLGQSFSDMNPVNPGHDIKNPKNHPENRIRAIAIIRKTLGQQGKGGKFRIL